MYRLGLEAILGVHRVGQVLRISPSIPKTWRSYRLTYRDDTTSYDISVDNPDGVNRGVRRVSLDGEILPSAEIPLNRDGGHHKVGVLMG
jgi:cellobiose phosphorylase